MANSDATQSLVSKTIKLNKLKPNKYRLWVLQAEATFEVHKCLNIVLSKEANQTPVNEDRQPLENLGAEARAQVFMGNSSCTCRRSFVQIS